MKKLYRSKDDIKVCGVCAGLAKFLNIDPTIVRILWVIISVATTGIPGSLVYLICSLIMPVEPEYDEFDMK